MIPPHLPISGVCSTDCLTFSIGRTLMSVLSSFLNPLKTEKTNPVSTAHPQPHQDVLFLNTLCCNQCSSCQAVLCPDVLNQLHNSTGGRIKLYAMQLCCSSSAGLSDLSLSAEFWAGTWQPNRIGLKLLGQQIHH